MKKIAFYISVLIIILVSLITVLIYSKNNIKDSVVYIESFDDETIKSGSGFAYKVNNDNMYIITSYHVIEGNKNIYVYNNAKEKIKADIVNYDEYTDIAVLNINNSLNLKAVSIGNSDKVKISDNIYVIGTPLSIENINTINKGVILNKEKEITINTTHGSSNLKAIEVDAEVDYGNSGGPLLNSDYEVIGMMFIMDENSQNKGYALPINFIIDIANKLINDELKRPNLGAVMCNTTNIELLNEYGINIDDVVGIVILEADDMGLLYNSGLQRGDVITKFDGKVVNNVNVLRQELYKVQVADTVEIEYYRNGTYYKVNIEL